MRILFLILSVSYLCTLSTNAQIDRQKPWETIRQEFQTMPMNVRPNPLWFWNNTQVEPTELKKQMASYKESGYGGLSILPFGKSFRPDYLSEAYFELYKLCVEEAKKLDLTLWLYDEYGFPSGSAGLHNADGISRFGLKHPEHIIKRLDKEEFQAAPFKKTDINVPEGILMGVVALDTITHKRVDLTKFVKEKKLLWDTPEGNWKILFFLCRNDEGIVDYLDADAVKLFTAMTHDEYYKRLSPWFGSTIVGTFFDEPTMYRAQGRSWTPKFNQKFEAKYGFNPVLYYPALWYNIGEETNEARNYLFGFRSDLYAEGFTKVVNDWSRQHGVWATGHQDNEEMLNAVGTSGDLMKCFKYLDIPGIDKIGGNRPAEHYYKIISSSAHNWDHSLIMSETYGAMGNISWDEIYSIAMDQYVKGINLLIPHAVWYDPSNVTFKPELSSRNPLYADGLRPFNDYLSRLNAVMQNDARWIGDIAVLYPIETMQSGHYMDGPLGHYKGGVEIPGLDYIDVGTHLFDSLGYDYMFLHPEVLQEKCTINKDKLILNNQVQFNQFSVLVFPGCKTSSLKNIEKAKAFAQAGGTVIFTSVLPENGTSMKEDKAIKKIMNELLPASAQTKTYGKSASVKKGKVMFVTNPDVSSLHTAMSELEVNKGLNFIGRSIRNTHKVLSGKNIWFLANPENKAVEVEFEINGNYKLTVWDPHSGEIYPVQNMQHHKNKTRIKMNVNKYNSLFLVEN